MSKKSGFRGPFDKQHGKRAQALPKSASPHFCPIHWSLPSELSLKMGPLLTCQILGLLLNTLAADEKFPIFKRNNMTIPIQIQLSQKKKTFLNFLFRFWNVF